MSNGFDCEKFLQPPVSTYLLTYFTVRITVFTVCGSVEQTLTTEVCKYFLVCRSDHGEMLTPGVLFAVSSDHHIAYIFSI